MEKEKLNNLGVIIDINSENNATLRRDLEDQLIARGKHEQYYMDLAADYIFYSNLKDSLKKDIDDRGLVVESMTGNGFKVEKPNDSLQNVIKTTNLMLKILKELQLNEPKGAAVDEEDTNKYNDSELY